MEKQAGAPEGWVRGFLLTCGARFGVFFALFQIEPVFPIYLRGMGASPFMIGLVMAAFPFGATVVRPLVGAYIDRLGSKVFLVGGLVIFVIAAAGYVWTASVLVALLLRTCHGFGWSGCTTSVGTLVAGIAPDHRRGALIAYSGAVSTVAGAVAPAMAFWMVGRWGFPALFLCAAAAAASGLAAAVWIREPARVRTETPRRRWFETFILPESLMPAVSMGLLGVSRGSVIAFLSLYALEVGLENPGHWFALFAVAVVAGRPIFGPLSDSKGRPFVIIPCYLLALAGMVVLSLAASPPMLLVSAAMVGLGYGSAHAALMTMAVDLAPRQRWGLSMAQYHLFYDLAIGLGGVAAGVMLDFTGNDYPAMFLATTVVGLCGFVWFLMRYRAAVAR